MEAQGASAPSAEPSNELLLLKLYDAARELRERLDEMGYGDLVEGDDTTEVLRSEIDAVSQASGTLTQVLQETRYVVQKKYGFWLDA